MFLVFWLEFHFLLYIYLSYYSKLFLPIAIIALSVYRLFFYRFHFWSSRYKTISKTYGVSEWLRTTEFTDDEIILTDHNSITKLQYNNIVKIKEKNNKINIIFNNYILVRLYKDAFVDCTGKNARILLIQKYINKNAPTRFVLSG